MTWSFLLTSLVICLAPGTGSLYTVAAGLTRGTRAGLLAAFACTLGTLPHMMAAITGLAALLHASGVAFQVVKYAGLAYLLWMAIATWRDRGALAFDEAGPSSTRKVIVSGITLNLLNPKLTVFVFAFLPQFVPAGEPGSLPRMVGLSSVFVLMTFVAFALYAVLAAALRDRVLTRPRVVDAMRKVFAGTFAALGTRLAFEQR